MFTLRKGALPDPSADILTEPYAHTYEWDTLGHRAPMLFRSETSAAMFGRTMLAGPFHVVPAQDAP